MELIEHLKGGLIVSCQVADEGGHRDIQNPVQGPCIAAAFATACVAGGAKGIRADGPLDIHSIRRVVDVPIIGIYKIDLPSFQVRITPTFEAAKKIVESGADIVAVDATNRTRPENISAKTLIRRIKKELNVPVMADISVFKEGIQAADAGADIIASTLSGHTSYSSQRKSPDLELVKKLANQVDIPVIAEGRITTPKLARQAIQMGAFAVVVGAMIVNARRITESFVNHITKSIHVK